MKKKNTYLVIILLLILGGGSFFFFKQTTVHNLQEYNKWLNSKKHGCLIANQIAGINISAKYQPPSYLVLKELGAPNTFGTYLKDSLFKKQNNMLTFLLTIVPDTAKGVSKRNSVMYEGVQNYADYVNRVLTTNFSMEGYISLYADGKEYKPVLSTVENIYELSQARNFIVVFADDEKHLFNCKELLLIYDDHFFDMGKVQFDFSGEDLKKARNVQIAWN